MFDKNFDPSTMEDLMKLFKVEAYKSCAGMELQHEKEAKEAENHLDSAMWAPMEVPPIRKGNGANGHGSHHGSSRSTDSIMPWNLSHAFESHQFDFSVEATMDLNIILKSLSLSLFLF